MPFPAPASPAEIAADLLLLSPEYAPTPLIDSPELAQRLRVGSVLAKDEGRRMLRSFKSLGGTYAGLRALARVAGDDIAFLLHARPGGLPALVCASDGNHGLAVAAAARFAGAPARIYLHAGVPPARAVRISDMGAEIVWVPGTYDDAVDAAAAASMAGAGILIADTSAEASDAVVADVMAGYGVIAAEIQAQVAAQGHARPTHVFVQAGVGGLAAAMASGLAAWLAPPACIVVVEPDQAPSVAAAFAAGHVVRVPGELETSAGMLSCGEASAPAFAVLRRHGAIAITVPERCLHEAPVLLLSHGGPRTTPSGGAGLAGLAACSADAALRARVRLGAESRVVVLITEAALDEA